MKETVTQPGKRPQVLLLGNGIIRAYSGLAMSWHELLLRIGTDKSIPDDVSIPMPLEIVLRTGDHVGEEIREHSRELYGCVDNEPFDRILKRILCMGFDDILTTNYSYELEDAAWSVREASDRQLRDSMRHTEMVKREDRKYLLHTYNRVEYNGHANRIWHIHGEARKPDSIVLGHFYYGNLLSACRQITLRRDHTRIRRSLSRKPGSWVDVFLSGDVYVLGFGYDYSEMELWWLLNQKKIEMIPGGGGVFYYRPAKPDHSFDVKAALLGHYGAVSLDCGMAEEADMCNGRPDSNAEKTAREKREREMYRAFYQAALDDIALKINGEGLLNSCRSERSE